MTNPGPSLWRTHRLLVVAFLAYIVAVILFFVAFGIGSTPMGVLTSSTALIDTTVDQKNDANLLFEDSPTDGPQTTLLPTSAPQTSALRSLGITLLILWYLIGLGSPAMGVFSYFAIFVGLIENQLAFVRVVRCKPSYIQKTIGV